MTEILPTYYQIFRKTVYDIGIIEDLTDFLSNLYEKEVFYNFN